MLGMKVSSSLRFKGPRLDGIECGVVRRFGHKGGDRAAAR